MRQTATRTASTRTLTAGQRFLDTWTICFSPGANDRGACLTDDLILGVRSSRNPVRRYQSRKERKEQLNDGIGNPFVSAFLSRVGVWSRHESRADTIV